MKHFQSLIMSVHKIFIVAAWTTFTLFACFDGKLSIVRLLIERGADIDLPTDVSQLYFTHLVW